MRIRRRHPEGVRLEESGGPSFSMSNDRSAEGRQPREACIDARQNSGRNAPENLERGTKGGNEAPGGSKRVPDSKNRLFLKEQKKRRERDNKKLTWAGQSQRGPCPRGLEKRRTRGRRNTNNGVKRKARENGVSKWPQNDDSDDNDERTIEITSEGFGPGGKMKIISPPREAKASPHLERRGGSP